MLKYWLLPNILFMIYEVKHEEKCIDQIKIFYLYINSNNELYNLKSEEEIIINNCLSKERLLYLIKKNQLNLIKHKLIGLLRYNIPLKNKEINKFINDEKNINYLSSLKILESITFERGSNILKKFNCIFLIYKNYENPIQNTTKKINMKKVSYKTRRKIT